MEPQLCRRTGRYRYDLLSYVTQITQGPGCELPPGYLLIPVVTLTMNLSGSPWGLSMSLSEYFGNDPVLMESPLWKYICNYRLHVIDPVRGQSR